MAIKKRTLKQDLLWLRWPLLLLALVIAGAGINYVMAFDFRNQMQRQEFQASADLDLISGQVREIEIAEEIIVNNIDRFNSMVQASILDEEDRVGLLEEIRTIRDRHQLFPITVEIREQERLLLNYGEDVELPEEQVSLRSSVIQITLPLLHEVDLMRFLEDFTGGGRLIVTNECSIRETVSAMESNLDPVQHQLADCIF